MPARVFFFQKQGKNKSEWNKTSPFILDNIIKISPTGRENFMSERNKLQFVS